MIEEIDAIVLSYISGRKMDVPEINKTEDFKGVACVFLDSETNSCSVYDYRPMACRISTSFDDPKKCDTEELRDMVSLNYILAQILMLIGPDILPLYETSRGRIPPADIRKFFKPGSAV